MCCEGRKDITDQIREFVVNEKVEEGICVVTVHSPAVSIVVLPRKRRDVWSDVSQDLDRIFPSRFNVQDGLEPCEASAASKAAVIGGTMEFIIHEGQLTLPPEDGIYLVDYTGHGQEEYTIKCI